METKEQKGEKDLKDFVAYAKSFEVFPERQTEIEMMMYAILTKEHVLLKGQPGTCKSMLSLHFLNGIIGSKTFKQQFTAFMDESYIFGPQLIDELKKGIIKHNTKDSLIDCDFAFLDEFFNANEETIIACNEPLNERTFTRNGQQEKCKLITAIMTTNQERENEKKLKPIYDRIMFSIRVLRVEDKKARMDMYFNALSGELDLERSFEKERLESVHEYIQSNQVTFYPGIFESFDRLLNEYQEQSNCYVSDRKAIKSLSFLKVVAMVNGRNFVEFSDLEMLRLVWLEGNNPKLSSIFDACLQKVKKDYAKIEKEIKFLANCEKLHTEIKEADKKAVGYPDYKALKIVAESFIKEANIIVADLEDGNSKDKVLEWVSEIQGILSKTVKSIRELTKSGTSEEKEDDFGFFENLAKKGVSTSKNKKTNFEGSVVDDIIEDKPI